MAASRRQSDLWDVASDHEKISLSPCHFSIRGDCSFVGRSSAPPFSRNGRSGEIKIDRPEPELELRFFQSLIDISAACASYSSPSTCSNKGVIRTCFKIHESIGIRAMDAVHGQTFARGIPTPVKENRYLSNLQVEGDTTGRHAYKRIGCWSQSQMQPNQACNM